MRKEDRQRLDPNKMISIKDLKDIFIRKIKEYIEIIHENQTNINDAKFEYDSNFEKTDYSKCKNTIDDYRIRIDTMKYCFSITNEDIVNYDDALKGVDDDK